MEVKHFTRGGAPRVTPRRSRTGHLSPPFITLSSPRMCLSHQHGKDFLLFQGDWDSYEPMSAFTGIFPLLGQTSSCPSSWGPENSFCCWSPRGPINLLALSGDAGALVNFSTTDCPDQQPPRE